jgi:putative heme iron utilization protein
MSLALEAQRFLFGAQKGVLSTHSAKFKDYPYGSVTPYVLNHQGMPVILISSIAEHTKNIIQNSNISLIVFNNDADLQENARLTLLAEAEQTNQDDALIRARYLRYIPQAESYFNTHDFTFYTLYISHARYIAGFGKMGWLEGSDFKIPSNPIFFEEAKILNHMNQDHVENLKAYCHHYHQIQTQSVEMIGIDSLGFDVRTDTKKVLRFNFENAISDTQEARAALVTMAKICRAQ